MAVSFTSVSKSSAPRRELHPFLLAGLAFSLAAAVLLAGADLLAARHSTPSLLSCWNGAYWHALIFGAIGSFVLRGAYSPTGQTRLAGLVSVLWTAGVAAHCVAGLTQWHWRVLLPLAVGLEFLAFLTALFTLRHVPRARELWVLVFAGATASMAVALVANLVESLRLALYGDGPAFPPGFEQRFLIFCVWAFAAPMAWGASVKLLRPLMRLKPIKRNILIAACVLDAIGVAGAVAGKLHVAAVLLLHAAIFLPSSLKVFGKSPPDAPPSDFAYSRFVRLAYVWLRVCATVGVWASVHDSSGIWSASRHGLLVGFVLTFTMALVQWALPVLSRTLSSASMVLLNLGCLAHVLGEILVYKQWVPAAAYALPVAAITEACAIVLFVVNLLAAAPKVVEQDVAVAIAAESAD